jgi:tetratricopeptide (TPR) repeat protein
MNYLKSQTANSVRQPSRWQACASIIVLSSVLGNGSYGQNISIPIERPLERAAEMLGAGSYLAAADIFLRADGIDRERGILGASKALALMGDYEEAVSLLQGGIDDYADSPLLSTQLAETLRQVGRSAEALVILEVVVSGNANPPVRALVQYYYNFWVVRARRLLP